MKTTEKNLHYFLPISPIKKHSRQQYSLISSKTIIFTPPSRSENTQSSRLPRTHEAVLRTPRAGRSHSALRSGRRPFPSGTRAAAWEVGTVSTPGPAPEPPRPVPPGPAEGRKTDLTFLRSLTVWMSALASRPCGRALPSFVCSD